jgi:hypothetical protein
MNALTAARQAAYNFRLSVRSGKVIRLCPWLLKWNRHFERLHQLGSQHENIFR